MDFAKMMKAQMGSRSATSKSTTSKAAAPSQPKFQRRGDVEAAREAAYHAEQARLETERQARAERKRKQQEEDDERAAEREVKRQRIADEARARKEAEDEKEERERRVRLGLPETPPETDGKSDDDNADEPDRSAQALVLAESRLSDAELDERLRAEGAPVTLFGESHKARVRRLLSVTKAAADKLALASTADEPIPTTLEPLPGGKLLVDKTLAPASDVPGRAMFARQTVGWLNLVLREWALALASRDADTANTFAGRAALQGRTQAVEHLTPLVRKLERLAGGSTTALPDDVLVPLAEIVRDAQARRYVAANDGYLQLSIGNAAWPIGVTMVGIHERSAREKIGEGGSGKSQAHIMADEATRKMLQGVKRCLSFAQTRWPPEEMDQMMG